MRGCTSSCPRTRCVRARAPCAVRCALFAACFVLCAVCCMLRAVCGVLCAVCCALCAGGPSRCARPRAHRAYPFADVQLVERLKGHKYSAERWVDNNVPQWAQWLLKQGVMLLLKQAKIMASGGIF